ncbi:hypothetical protein CWI36_0630p0010 [Hamiltosporidium magnivora]|uniref:Uncharacterized protein n=1 Tax=Hamiltosporidium magnivora TaxID=148818 RepID=A0A4Q9LEJ6_9MICR|nr:hypothetical protein CWI36_0630p0010 [Hamiltosporidium magnivora]
MRELHFDLSKTNDLSEALVKKNMSLNVYEKKITMYESMRSRKENLMFDYTETNKIAGVKKFMNNIGWEINKDMSAVTDLCCKDTVLFLKEKFSAIFMIEMYSDAQKLCLTPHPVYKTINHLAARFEKMLGHEILDEMMRWYDVYIYFGLINIILSLKNELETTRSKNFLKMNTRIRTDVKIRCNRPDIFLYDKKKYRIPFIEETMININEESDFEEEIEVFEILKRNI